MTRILVKAMRRFFISIGIFESLTIAILLIYLYYLSHTLISSPSHEQLKILEENPVFKIQKQNTSSTVSASPTKVCSVTVAIILCEDDRYLSVKNKTNNDAKGQNTTRKLSTFQRGTIAKDFSRQINQTLVLMKSIAILTKFDKSSSSISPCVEFLLLADKPTHYEMITKVIQRQWSRDFQELVKVINVPVRYPPGSLWMRKLFRPCATLRLFLAEILPSNVDSVIYVDTDIIFFQSIQELWKRFQHFDKPDHDHDNATHKSGSHPKKVAAMAPCLFHYGTSANSVPFYGTSGLNAGIMLMNLTRMRMSQWTNKIRMVTTLFQDKIILADQDILNIYFHFFPEELMVLTCDWNFRPFQCREGSYCTDPELTQGISALHGNALSFTSQGPEPLFHSVFKTFHRVKLDKNFGLNTFLGQLETSLVKAEETAYLSTSHCKRYGGLDVLLLNRLYGLLEQ